MNLQGVDWPAFGLEDDVRPLLAELIGAREAGVLATLFACEGGSPRGVGTQMLFGAGRVVGYLSGGCVEADVALHAAAVLQSGEPKTLIYGVGGPADVRLPCGGRIEVMLERIAPDDPAAHRLVELHWARTPALWLSDGRTRRCLALREPASDLPESLRPALEAAITGGVCARTGEAIFRRFDPPTRLVVIGADPPALAMAMLGSQIGFATTFVRPKGPAAPPPIPGVRYLRSAPADALAEAGLDPWTCVAVATHDAELDEPALAAALRSDVGYIGVLGSRRRLPERLAGLRALGFSKADLGRLHAPIGLPLAGKSPWEIAVSVIGEMVQSLRAREAAAAWPRSDPGSAGAGAPLYAVVLAAGRGSRWGGAKLLADWRGAPLLHGALAAAFSAPVERVVLVTGAHGEEVAACARACAERAGEGARLDIVHAPRWADGLSASLRRGIEALPPDAAGALLFLGDMPAVPKAVLAPLADALAAGAPAAAPAFAGRRGHPVAVSRALFPQLARLQGDRGAAPVLAALGARLALVPAPDAGVHLDIDAPADMEVQS
jgi:xanthine dehydrogenase accessory factor